MTGLFLDTSSERAVLFFFKERVQFIEEFPFGLNNSKSIFPVLQKGLNALNIDMQAISFIAVGTGPGSYTGMRVGASVAMGLAYAGRIPLVGVPSLASYVPAVDGPFAAIVDAKIRGVYLMTGVLSNGTLHHTSIPQVLPLEALESTLLQSTGIVTPNAALLRPKLEALYPHIICQWKESPLDPNQMAKLALQAIPKSGLPSIELLYL